MSNVRRVSDEEGLSGHGRQANSAVIVHDHFAIAWPCPKRQGWHGRESRGGDPLRFRAMRPFGMRRPAATRYRPEPVPGSTIRTGEADSAAHWTMASMIWARREGRALGPPFGWRPKSTKRFAQRVFPSRGFAPGLSAMVREGRDPAPLQAAPRLATIPPPLAHQGQLQPQRTLLQKEGRRTCRRQSAHCYPLTPAAVYWFFGSLHRLASDILFRR